MEGRDFARSSARLGGSLGFYQCSMGNSVHAEFGG